MNASESSDVLKAIQALGDRMGRIEQKISEIETGGSSMTQPDGLLNTTQPDGLSLKEQLLQDLDFNRIHQVMKFLEWRWAPQARVPNVDELKDAAKDMIDEVLAGLAKTEFDSSGWREYSVSSGGLTVTISEWNEQNSSHLYGKIAFEASWAETELERKI